MLVEYCYAQCISDKPIDIGDIYFVLISPID